MEDAISVTARLIETPLGLGLVDDDAPELSPLVIDLAHGRKLRADDDLVKALGRDKGVVSVVDRLAGGGEAIQEASGGAPYRPLVTIDELYPDRPDRS